MEEEEEEEWLELVCREGVEVATRESWSGCRFRLARFFSSGRASAFSKFKP